MTDTRPSEISAATRYCAVLGHPIGHSASPAMQNAGITALGLDWRYLAFDVRPTALREAIEGARAMRFLGLNLTIPHKVLAVEMVDVLDVEAQPLGAVNTLRFEGRQADGGWLPLGCWASTADAEEVRVQGFNTDAAALLQALGEEVGFEPRDATVLVLGTGGAGRVATLRLAREGVRALFLVNRTREKAEALAAEIRGRHPGVGVLVGYPARGAAVELVLNATSLGLRPEDGLPWDEGGFSLSQARAVYDMIYRPAVTPLLEAARRAGCRTANGLSMLLYQGARALELWCGRPAPLAVMRRTLTANVYAGGSA